MQRSDFCLALGALPSPVFLSPCHLLVHSVSFLSSGVSLTCLSCLSCLSCLPCCCLCSSSRRRRSSSRLGRRRFSCLVSRKEGKGKKLGPLFTAHAPLLFLPPPSPFARLFFLLPASISTSTSTSTSNLPSNPRSLTLSHPHLGFGVVFARRLSLSRPAALLTGLSRSRCSVGFSFLDSRDVRTRRSSLSRLRYPGSPCRPHLTHQLLFPFFFFFRFLFFLLHSTLPPRLIASNVEFALTAWCVRI